MASICELYAAEQKAKDEEETVSLGTKASKKDEPNDATIQIDADDEEKKDPVGNDDDEDEVKECKDSFHRLADRLVAQKLDIVVDQKEVSSLVQALKGTCAIRDEIGEGKLRAIIYDSKTSGESVTAPWRRLPPLKSAMTAKLIGSSLKVLGGENMCRTTMSWRSAVKMCTCFRCHEAPAGKDLV